MTSADVVYAIWAFVALSVLVLWAASVRGWRVGAVGVGRPGALLRDLLGSRPWLRALLVAGWIWVGVHSFAR
jgi:hypothetical protein